MRVLSLFDGISCGYEALKRAGIPVSEYHAFEIDKYAIQIAKKNHPDIIHHGSVVEANFQQFKGFDLLIGGSPCQDFSFAGKQKGLDGDRSSLFFEYVRALHEINPRFYLLENVKMKQEFLAHIDFYVGSNRILINSALVSAQNRNRWYWTNFKVEQPTDRGLLLKDIIEEGATDRDKRYCIDANYWKGASLEQYLQKSRRQLIFSERKANCARARCNNETLPEKGVERVLDKKIGNLIFGAAQRGRNIEDGKRKDYLGAPTEQRIEFNLSGKSNCISTVQKDSLVVEARPRELESFRSLEDKSKTPLASMYKGSCSNGQTTISEDGIFIRKLTPLECERLQTLPDGYTEGISSTQRYKALGNGWTVDVIAHIFNQMKEGLQC